MRLRENGIYGLRAHGVRKTLQEYEGTIVPTSFNFPESEYILLSSMREARQSGSRQSTFYYLLYRFRRFDYGLAQDRIYGLISLSNAEDNAGISVDYRIHAAQLYINATKALVVKHKHLLIFNCTRASHQDGIAYQQTIDQGRFVDPQARVVDGLEYTPRRGWRRLPEGWERIVEEKNTFYINHNSGQRQSEGP